MTDEEYRTECLCDCLVSVLKSYTVTRNSAVDLRILIGTVGGEIDEVLFKVAYAAAI